MVFVILLPEQELATLQFFNSEQAAKQYIIDVFNSASYLKVVKLERHIS